MPEGDTVWLACRRLREALAGDAIVECDLRVPALATVDLRDQQVADVVPRGKHILMRLSSGLTLHSHLRMDGSWHVYARGTRWSGGPAHEVRAVIGTDRTQVVGFRVHDLELIPTGEEDRLVGHLGPDVLGPDWDPDEVVRRMLEQPDRAIGDALLDQRNLAGVGNLYRAEVLFLTGTSPWQPVGTVRDLPRMVTLAARLIDANKDRWEQVTTGDTRRGQQHWVFERAGKPCRRCGTRIRTTRSGDYQRIAYWCPACQPG